MVPSLLKLLLLLFVIYLVRTIFRMLAMVNAAQRRPSGPVWRGNVGRQPDTPAQTPSWAVGRQNVALDLVRCERCTAYVPPKTACERADCPSK